MHFDYYGCFNTQTQNTQAQDTQRQNTPNSRNTQKWKIEIAILIN